MILRSVSQKGYEPCLSETLLDCHDDLRKERIGNVRYNKPYGMRAPPPQASGPAMINIPKFFDGSQNSFPSRLGDRGNVANHQGNRGTGHFRVGGNVKQGDSGFLKFGHKEGNVLFRS
jgi:hypothetical protein